MRNTEWQTQKKIASDVGKRSTAPLSLTKVELKMYVVSHTIHGHTPSSLHPSHKEILYSRHVARQFITADVHTTILKAAHILKA